MVLSILHCLAGATIRKNSGDSKKHTSCVPVSLLAHPAEKTILLTLLAELTIGNRNNRHSMLVKVFHFSKAIRL